MNDAIAAVAERVKGEMNAQYQRRDAAYADAAKTALAYLHYRTLNGATIKEVSEELGIRRQQFYRWQHRYGPLSETEAHWYLKAASFPPRMVEGIPS